MRARRHARLSDRLWREWLALAACLCGLTFLLAYGAWTWRVDQTLYDAGLALLERPSPDDVVIVAIDEESLAALGRWPWRRGLHASLLDRLSKARAVGLDVVFSESGDDPRGDAALAEALRRNGKTVLPVIMENRPGRGLVETLPLPAIAAAAARLGHVHLEVDIDGMVRSVYLREGPGEARWAHMASALLEVAGIVPPELTAVERAPAFAAPAPGSAAPWRRDGHLVIPFAGPPGHFARVSYLQVLRGDVDAAQFAGKIVLIGATATGLGDSFPTPVSGLARQMPGVEVTANVLEALRNGSGVRRATPLATASVSAALVLALLAGLLLLPPRSALWLVLGLAAGALVAGMLLLALWHFWFPPVTQALAALLAYPLWSWRRLEAAGRHLDEELARLEAEPDLLEHRAQRTAKSVDFVVRRIAAVELAGERARDLRRFVTDTLDKLPDTALVADAEGRVMLANARAAREFGAADAPALKGKTLAELLGTLQPRGGHTWAALLEACSGEASEQAAEGVHADGRALLVKLARWRSAREEAPGWIVLVADVTEIKLAERRRDEMLSFLSHDLRSPQASIIGLIDLQRLDPNVIPWAECVERIERLARKTLDLSEGFVQLSRAESKPLDVADCDLGEIARECMDDVAAQGRAKNIAIESGEWLQEARVRADRTLIGRALTNLITNAIKYSPSGTIIRLSVLREGDALRCVIADQGPGISAEDLPRMFQSFQRVDSDKNVRRKEGAGLGLAFVRTVAERHGGRVGVESELGHGSRFWLQLPAA